MNLINVFICLQLYELSNDAKRREFLDDLFSFMQKRGKFLPLPFLLCVSIVSSVRRSYQTSV